VDTVGLTFDALDRMVEQARGTSYTEIVYAPSGGKLALMNGQTLQKAFVPLPGQATAIYTSAGLDHYRHSDWLGSARLTSSPSRAYLSSVAYAPFGETYASSGTTDPSFTGMNPDTVSTDYDFLFREYSTQGRWPSPDPAGVDAVDPSNPQSWNGYAYVLGNPLAFTDPLGLCGQVGETPFGNYNFGGGSCHLPNYPSAWAYPCFGFIGYWHTGCPQRPPMPPQPTDDQKKKEEAKKKACQDATAKVAAIKARMKAEAPQVRERLKDIGKEAAAGAAVGCVLGIMGDEAVTAAAAAYVPPAGAIIFTGGQSFAVGACAAGAELGTATTVTVWFLAHPVFTAHIISLQAELAEAEAKAAIACR
jgi:RHS repeat-associated protein